MGCIFGISKALYKCMLLLLLLLLLSSKLWFSFLLFWLYFTTLFCLKTLPILNCYFADLKVSLDKTSYIQFIFQSRPIQSSIILLLPFDIYSKSIFHIRSKVIPVNHLPSWSTGHHVSRNKPRHAGQPDAAILHGGVVSYKHLSRGSQSYPW